MKDTPPIHTPRAPLRTPITGFLMLPRISQTSAHAKLFTHTSSSRRSPSTLSGAGPVPRSQPRVLGGSKGREAGSACFSIYLFVGPAYTFQALITPGGREEGHTAGRLGL